MSRMLAVISLALFQQLASAAVVESRFDTDADGWDGITFNNVANSWFALEGNDNPYTLGYSSTGGNPGGYVSFVDPNFGDSYFRAPAAYRGNLSAYAGGTLSFDRSDISGGGSPYVNPLVALVSGNTVIVNGGAAPTLYPDWSSYSFGLNAAGWRFNSLGGAAVSDAEFALVLANVSALYISAEAWSPVVETGNLDNVRLASPVPVPAALLMFAPALLALTPRRS
jgi:hypothetical protein